MRTAVRKGETLQGKQTDKLNVLTQSVLQKRTETTQDRKY
jgi:hypothetical protein